MWRAGWAMSWAMPWSPDWRRTAAGPLLRLGVFAAPGGRVPPAAGRAYAGPLRAGMG